MFTDTDHINLKALNSSIQGHFLMFTLPDHRPQTPIYWQFIIHHSPTAIKWREPFVHTLHTVCSSDVNEIMAFSLSITAIFPPSCLQLFSLSVTAIFRPSWLQLFSLNFTTIFSCPSFLHPFPLFLTAIFYSSFLQHFHYLFLTSLCPDFNFSQLLLLRLF